MISDLNRSEVFYFHKSWIIYDLYDDRTEKDRYHAVFYGKYPGSLAKIGLIRVSAEIISLAETSLVEPIVFSPFVVGDFTAQQT